MIKRLRSAGLLLFFTGISILSMPLAAKGKKHSSEKAYKGDGRHRSDPEMRTLLRSQAPFFVEERHRNTTVRLNKDGTFIREGVSGSPSNEGHWKVKSGKLRLKWNTGEEYGYRLSFSGKTPLISGKKSDKQKHYVLKTAD